MLEVVDQINAVQTTVRCANPRDEVSALQDLLSTEQPVDVYLDFIGRPDSGALERLVSELFEPKQILAGRYGSETRYSDGTWPVYYCSLDRNTAVEEILFHYRRRTGRDAPDNIFYKYIRTRISGATKGLRTKSDEWPFMINKDISAYQDCWPLGREAVDDSELCSLTVPSARMEGGTNLPTFRLQCITEPELVEVLSLSRDRATNSVQVTTQA